MNRLLPPILAALAIACGPRVDNPPMPATPEPIARVQPAPAQPPYTEAAGEIVRMVQAGLPEAMIRNQILLRRTAANIAPDEMIRMNRDGVSQSLLSVLQQHDAQLAARERSRHDERLRHELRAEIAKLRGELRTNRPVTIAVSNPPPQIVVQNNQPVRETFTERTIIREQVPVYVGYTLGTGGRPHNRRPRSIPNPVSGTSEFVPPRQGNAGFAAPVSGFAAPVSSSAPVAFTNGNRQAWRYYTGPGGSGN